MVPVAIIRKNMIIRKLSQCGAFTEDTAKTFSEAGIFNPNGFKKITDALVEKGILARTKENKYYLNK